jgi:polysaccharide export outer membrane protein
MTHWARRILFTRVRLAAESAGHAVILVLLTVYGWFPAAAQADGLPLSNAQNNVSLSVPNGVGPSNAMVLPAQTTATAQKPGGSTHAATEAAHVANAGSTDGMDALDDRHKLNIGDRLSFRIVEDAEDPIQISVTASGDLEVPYIGRYPAAGKTCKELAWKLKAELEKEHYYHATVIIAVNEWAKTQGKVYIAGPVRVSGPQEIPSDEVLTLSKAILRAGGFGDYADRRNVRVTRKSSIPGGKDQVFTVNVVDILEKGKTDSDLPLEAGDLIFVPERLVRF